MNPFSSLIAICLLTVACHPDTHRRNDDVSFYIYEDSTSAQLFEAISDPMFGGFKPMNSNEISHPPTNATLWIRFKAVSELPSQYLELSSPTFAEVCYWQPIVEKVFKKFRTGYLMPFATRPIEIDRFVFPISDQKEWHYLSLKTDQYMIMQLHVKPLQAVMDDAAARNILYNAYLVFMLLAIMGVIFYVFLIRQYNYLFYAAYVFFMSAAVLTEVSYYFQLFWPNTPVINRYFTIFPYCIAICLLSFLGKIWTKQTATRILYKTVWFLTLAALPCNIYLLQTGQQAQAITLTQLHTFIFIALTIVGSFLSYSASTGVPKQSLKLISIGLLVLSASAIVFIFRVNHILPNNFFTENALIFGSALEVCFLTAAVIIRSDEIHNNIKKGLAERKKNGA